MYALRVNSKSEPFRMLQWLLAAVVVYALAAFGVAQPQAQTVLWKLGHLMLAAWVGYMIDRHAFRARIHEQSHPLEHIRRAIIIAAAMLSIALGA